jgi:hypothetical protein
MKEEKQRERFLGGVDRERKKQGRDIKERRKI